MKIPLVDLSSQYELIKNDIEKAISSVINETAFVGSPNNRFNLEFEKQFAEYIGVNNCVGCANGTDALEIILKAYGIGPGDEVIVPSLTWISTSESVGTCGALPVFVDIDPDYYTIDPDKIESAITAKTKAIIPVHYYGIAAPMDKIMDIAKKHNLIVIEDSAQAHGATYKNRKIGTFGDAATFSFFPSKNLGAYGDAGCIVTNNNEIALKARMISNHGMIKRHEHEFEGRNSRLDGMQAAILNVKLPHLDKWNEDRIKNAEKYNSYLSDKVIKPSRPDYVKHVYHLYAIQVEKRDELKDFLKENGIETSVHYPVPLPYLNTYKHRMFGPDQFPVSKSVSEKVLSLPMFPELTEEQIKYVSEKVNEFVNK